MRNDNCIYCGTKLKKKHTQSKEHVFPDGLRQEDAEGFTLNWTICQRCNNKFGKELDRVIISQSEIGLIHHEFECSLIHNELGGSQSRDKSSFYHEIRYGSPPLRIFANLVDGDNPPMIIAPTGFTEFKDVAAVRTICPMSPQIILRQGDSETSYKTIVSESRSGFDVSKTSVDDVYCIGPNVHVFGPIAAKRYYCNPGEFADKYLETNTPKKALWLVIPDSQDSRLLSDTENFERFFAESTKESTTVWNESRWIPQNHKIVMLEHADYSRGIAKIAFHCYLYRNWEGYNRNAYTGAEPIFEGIKAFIHKDEVNTNPVKKGPPRGYIPLGEDAVVLPGGREIAHVLRFLENGNNIVCIIEFFVGTHASLTFSVALAGCYEETRFDNRDEVDCWIIPYKVLPKHAMLKRIVNPSHYTLIANPSNYSVLSLPGQSSM